MSGSISASTVAMASMALAAAGTAATVKGQMDAQAAAGGQANYLAGVARNNQAVARMQADDALRRGEIDAAKQRDITGQRLGTQMAALSAQGTDLEGSPTDILGDTAKSGELDAQTIRANATRAAWGYNAVGAGYGAEAAMRGSFQPSNLGAGASLLGGASTLAAKWAAFQFPAAGRPGAGAGSGAQAGGWGFEGAGTNNGVMNGA